mmetsp:Transcript_68481/g.222903  ORF Transcript_68481/g.222903 Transcript_68481/m.222903 type:complete len:430 (-) Transcript_68481:222-1511(-)
MFWSSPSGGQPGQQLPSLLPASADSRQKSQAAGGMAGFLHANSLLECLQQQAILLWVVLPIFALFQGLIPSLRPTCSSGVADVSYIFVVFAVGAYTFSEAQAWSSTKALASAPEMMVLRTFGVLRARKWLFLFGMLEIINLYNDLTFPLLSYHCQGELTQKWAASLAQQVGPDHFGVVLLRRIHVWHLSAFCTVASVLVGLHGLFKLLNFQFISEGHYAQSSSQYTPMTMASSDGDCRIPGEDCMQISYVAEYAGVPSVARLSQEIGLQRRYVFDAKESLGGALGSARIREGVLFGKLNRESIHELRDAEQQERVDDALSLNLRSFLVGKVIIGNVLQMWMQVMFLQLAFDKLGGEARGKLVARIALSVTHVIFRTWFKMVKCDCCALALASFAVSVAVWACVKAYFVFTCPSHEWHLLAGCIAAQSVV